MRRTIIFAVLTTMLFAAACGGDGGGDAGRTPAASPSVTGSGTPAATPTVTGALGIPVLNRVMAAIAANDPAALAALVTYARTPCETTPRGAGGPAICREGEAEGTLVDAVLAAQCEGFYVRPDELTLDDLQIGTSQASGAWRKSDVFSLPSRYVMIFERSSDVPPQGAAWALVLDDDGIIAIDYGCGQSPADMAQARGLTDGDRIAP